MSSSLPGATCRNRRKTGPRSVQKPSRCTSAWKSGTCDCRRAAGRAPASRGRPHLRCGHLDSDTSHRRNASVAGGRNIAPAACGRHRPQGPPPPRGGTPARCNGANAVVTGRRWRVSAESVACAETQVSMPASCLAMWEGPDRSISASFSVAGVAAWFAAAYDRCAESENRWTSAPTRAAWR